MIKMQADFKPMAATTGAILGMVSVMDDTDVKDGIGDTFAKKAKDGFMASIIAAKEAGLPSVQHVFEWLDEEIYSGEMSNIPLFKITVKTPKGGAKLIGFTFLPSNRVVPKPDPDWWGFDPKIVGNLSDHVFRFKAIVMETNSSVDIVPKGDNRLFIPSRVGRYGYALAKSSTINPGGEAATGGFTTFWNSWFEANATRVATETTDAIKTMFINRGRRIVRARSRTTGRFVAARQNVYAVAEASENAAREEMRMAIKADKYVEEYGDLSEF